MGNKGTYKQHKFENDPEHSVDTDPDFDLDEYILEKSQETEGHTNLNSSFEEEETSAFKNTVLIFMVFAAAFLWYHDWSPAQAWNAVFGSDSSYEVVTQAPDINIDIPNIEIPDIPLPPDFDFEGSFADYLVEIKNAGLDELFTNSGYQALYQSGVHIEYLEQLNNAGYLEGDFSYSAVIGLYTSGVPIEYINGLSELDLLDEFSYSAIIGLYNSGVSMEYLSALDQAGYLDDFSYSAIIGMYNAGVTVEYINGLAERNLLENLSYSDIIRMYNTDQ